ncbi:MAG: DUF1553 domain-containing protein [Verrucomicrobiales bacterium]|nr:DUF1553 domain-containing protein [Verrucomicrobiales bacterium]
MARLSLFFIVAGWSAGLLSAADAPPPASLSIQARSGTSDLRLIGPDATQQLAVTAYRPGQRFGEVDATRSARYTVEPAGVAAVDGHGLLRPLADGAATVTAELGGVTARLAVKVESFGQAQPISFPNDVVPVFTRNGCNMGACHAKTTEHNGFHLSLFGYDARQDYEMLALQVRSRRVFPAAPEHSLLLMKATGELPHGGGARLDPASADYLLLKRWIGGGLPFAPEGDPTVERIEVAPRERVLAPGDAQQLVVTAFLSNGTTRDITHAAQYEGNQPDMAEAEESGLVRIGKKPGSTSVLVRFQEHVDVFLATVPLGDEIKDLPKPNNFIDEEILNKLSLLGLPPSDLCDDQTFIRRVTLDIAGRLPTLEETRSFLASADPNKRAARIDALLEGTDYADFFAGKWAGLLRNKAEGGDGGARDTYGFHGWLRGALIADRPFSEVAAELVTASGKTGENPAASWYRAVIDPKERMQDIAQVFLGVRMQCAQCHHHPYEKWSQDDYYSFAAFFSTLQRKEVHRLPEDDILFHNRKPAEMKNPASGAMLKPAVLGGAPLDIPAEEDPRRELAKWLREPENPYFAKVLVNRYWKHFFGRALSEPEDDIRPTNPASHPALLDRLAGHFVESDHSLKDLVRTICNSRTYQLSSEPKEGNAEDTQNFARYYPKRLPAEVLLDAFNDITGAENSFSKLPIGVRAIALPDDSANKQSEFLTMFGRPQMDTACECERTSEANLGQSLHLIASDLIQQKLSTGTGRAALLAKAAERSDDDRLRDLYLTGLSREPTADELALARAHLKKKRDLAAADPAKLPPAQAEQQAFEDIIWVLANTKEFLFNR